MKNKARKTKNGKMEAHSRVKCKMKINADTMKGKWKHPSAHRWMDMVTVQSLLYKGSNRSTSEKFPWKSLLEKGCGNTKMEMQLPYDRGK